MLWGEIVRRPNFLSPAWFHFVIPKAVGTYVNPPPGGWLGFGPGSLNQTQLKAGPNIFLVSGNLEVGCSLKKKAKHSDCSPPHVTLGENLEQLVGGRGDVVLVLLEGALQPVLQGDEQLSPGPTQPWLW